MMRLPRRAAVAAALAAAGGDGCSGESLACDLGISRVAVGKHVAALRDLGYVIDAIPRVGYRMRAEPEACLPETVAPRLADPLWVACEGGLQTASTNADAKRLARGGAEAGTLVVAAAQTGGRGRFDRTWDSPPGGVYASAVLRPPLAPFALGPLPLTLAVGAARGLGSLGIDVRLKWPNDLMLEGRKLAGILVEMAAEVDRVEWAVAGIGVNVARASVPGAAWVRERLPGACVADVAAAVLDGMGCAYRAYIADGFTPELIDAYRALGALWGHGVVVRDAAGRTIADGIAEGIDESGALTVRTAAGTRAVRAGEVTLR